MGLGKIAQGATVIPRNATGITPNKLEAALACGVGVAETDALLEAVGQIQQSGEFGFVALTRGNEGITLIDHAGAQHFPAEARQVYDVSGAGDTVVAKLAMALAAGLAPGPACVLANTAAGGVVGKVGTLPISQTELQQTLERQNALEQIHKQIDHDTLAMQVDAWRSQGLRIVFTNGCFDLLHEGHVTYLEQARKLGDRLVVGLNADRSVSALKGPSRPVIREDDRARVLCALESVNAVTLFDDDTPLRLIRCLKPDVLVKGSDYAEDQVVGAADVRSWGGRSHSSPYCRVSAPAPSSTSLADVARPADLTPAQADVGVGDHEDRQCFHRV